MEKNLQINHEKRLRHALLNPSANTRYTAEGLTVDLSHYPSAADLISVWSNCDIRSNGCNVIKGATFNHCSLEGSFSFYSCVMDGATIFPADKGIELLAIIGGSLKGVKLCGYWESFNFSPNQTNNVVFSDDFYVHDLILRISCNPMNGVIFNKHLIAKVLAGMMFGQDITLPNKDLVEMTMGVLKQKIGL